MAEPAPACGVLDLDLADRGATRRLGARLARALRVGDLVGLAGPLGAGKTTLARDVIEALAGAPVEVPSPTFTLVQTYDVGGLAVWHFDLFRIEDAAEIVELGFDDALAEGAALVEWPEKLGWLAPADRLEVTLAQGAAADARRVRLAGFGAWRRRVAALAEG